MKKKLRFGIYTIFSLIFLWLFTGLPGSWIATHPKFVKMGSAENYFGSEYAVETLGFRASDGQKVAAWYIPNHGAKNVAILLAGIGGNRLKVVERAKLYLAEGFGVLLPDLRGTGESTGGIITFGWQERLDLLAAVDFLQSKNIENIGVHGWSLGAATISYTFPDHPPYQFVVMEAPYDNIRQALKNRADLFGLPLWFFRPLIWWTERRIEVNTSLLAPEEYMHHYQGPFLLVAGDSEIKVKKTETEKIFRKIASKRKQLHFFKGARHVDYLLRDRKEYEGILLPWIKQFAPKKKHKTEKF